MSKKDKILHRTMLEIVKDLQSIKLEHQRERQFGILAQHIKNIQLKWSKKIRERYGK